MVTKDIDLFKIDVAKFNDFLLEHKINVLKEDISFDFMYSMISLSGMEGDIQYMKGICHYLKHMAKREGMNIEEIIKKEE